MTTDADDDMTPENQVAAPEATEGDALYDKAFEVLMERFEGPLLHVATHPGDVRMALWAFMLQTGMGHALGVNSAVDIANKLYGDPKRKAAVSAFIGKLKTKCKLPDMPGNRSDYGKENMTKARENRLKK